MGYCCDCKYSYVNRKTALGGILTTDTYICSVMNKAVDKYGSCNKFVEMPNEENMGYKGGADPGTGFSGCFLTSACVDYLGKPDDCEELTVLRKFRDEYMKSTEEGSTLVDEYYAVAPDIVEKIDASEKRGDYYDYIYNVICKCIDLIAADENEQALNEYRAMVCRLSDELLKNKGE